MIGGNIKINWGPDYRHQQGCNHHHLHRHHHCCLILGFYSDLEWKRFAFTIFKTNKARVRNSRDNCDTFPPVESGRTEWRKILGRLENILNKSDLCEVRINKLKCVLKRESRQPGNVFWTRPLSVKSDATRWSEYQMEIEEAWESILNKTKIPLVFPKTFACKIRNTFLQGQSVQLKMTDFYWTNDIAKFEKCAQTFLCIFWINVWHLCLYLTICISIRKRS